MPEVGVIPPARHAMMVARTVLPPYRLRFSRHRLTPPHLLAPLGVMRQEDSIARGPASGAPRAPPGAGLAGGARSQLPLPLPAPVDLDALPHNVGVVAHTLRGDRCPATDATVALDGMWLKAGAVSPFFIRRAKEHGAPRRGPAASARELLLIPAA